MSEGVSLSDQKQRRVCVVACDGRAPGVVSLTLDPKRHLGSHPNRPTCATESVKTSGHKWRQRSALLSSNRFSARIGALCVPTLA